MKKLLNKKGSVLFLVVVVMSILIIAASATFYVVNNQTNSVNVRYSSEQSYQTAVSVSDTVSRYVDGYLEAIAKSGKDLSEFEDTIVGQMLNMKTPGKNMDITSKIDLSSVNMGEANVNITYKGYRTDPENSDNTIYTYDIKTTSEFNGETVIVTEVKEIVLGPAEYFTRFLTSTGGRPEDVILQCGELFSDAYFENDYTALGGGNSHLHDSIYATGTFSDAGIIYDKNPAKHSEIVIGENFYINSAGGNGVDVNEVFVGGNLIYNQNKEMHAKNIYVMGDLEVNGTIGNDVVNYFVNGDCRVNRNISHNATFYVNGNLYVSGSVNGDIGAFYVKGSVELQSTCNINAAKIKCDETKLTNNATSYSHVNLEDATASVIENDINNALLNSKNVLGSPVSTWTEVSEYITTCTKVNRYEDWDAEGYFFTKFPTAQTIDLNVLATKLNWTETFDADGTVTKVTVGGDERYVYEDYTKPVEITQYKQYSSSYLAKIDKSCKIVPVNDSRWNQYGNIILFDATDEDLYIYLDSNGMVDSDGRKLFSFFDGKSGTSVLVRGTHSVVFILPSDTSFRINTQQFIGHEDFAKYLADVTSIDEKIKNQTAIYSTTNDDTKAKISPILKDITVSGTKLTIMDQTVVGSTDVHNNIFIVTTGKERDAIGKLTNTLTNNYIDTNTPGGLSGYIYAPFSEMRCNGSYQGMQFFGGLIIGSYTYKNPITMLAFTSPYDYSENWKKTPGDTDPAKIDPAKYKPNDIVKYMIRFANGNGVIGDPTDTGSLQGFRTAGYR